MPRIALDPADIPDLAGALALLGAIRPADGAGGEMFDTVTSLAELIYEMTGGG